MRRRGLPGDSSMPKLTSPSRLALPPILPRSSADGSTETCSGGDVFHWPAHHSLRVEEDAEIILFSELAQHAAVMDHINAKLAAVT